MSRDTDDAGRLATELACHAELHDGLPLEAEAPTGGGGSAEAPAEPDGGEDRLAALEELEASLQGCTRCPLHEGRTNLVFSRGDPRADLAFVGEGPGANEDRLGEPFVGRSGKLLDEIVDAMGFRRDEIYVANIVKCRPPNNRTPFAEERSTCHPFLREQLRLVRPEVVVTLGSTAAQVLLDTTRSVGELRGRWHEGDGYRVMPTYHPAYLLRTPSAKRKVWSDVQKVMAHFGKSP